MKVSDLTGAQLDYHTARAQGIPAERLEVRRVPRTDTLICVHRIPCEVPGRPSVEKRFNPSGDWTLTGPLVEQHRLTVRPKGGYWLVESFAEEDDHGSNMQEAICRAVVRAAFGEEIEEVAVCE